ncbi:MAG: rhomboid family intramembrane serine protease [Halobacteria archaeon]
MSLVSLASYTLLAVAFCFLAAGLYMRTELLFTALNKAKSRWVLGLPIGSVLLIILNLVFYLTAQNGLDHPSNPLIIPFFTWSYGYPLGFLASPISHANVGHISANLMATAVFAPAAEYIIGHKNHRRPVFAAGGFAASWYLVGVLLALFSWGPSAGFSGVVFALFGFVTVYHPVKGVALLVLKQVADTFFDAVAQPVVVEKAGETFQSPWWANIAVESHALGFLVGIILGVYLAKHRDVELDGFLTGGALLTVGVIQNLYIWNTGGPVLYRGVGLGGITVASVLIGYAVSLETRTKPLRNVSKLDIRRTASVLILLTPLLFMATVAVTLNTSSVVSPPHDTAVETVGYSITYEENVTNRKFSNNPLVQQAPVNFTVSGVIVSNPGRGIWIQQITAEELKNAEEKTFYVGGLTWEKEIQVKRRSISGALGNESYSVNVSIPNGSKTVFEGQTAEAGVRLQDWNLSLRNNGTKNFAVLSKNNVTESIELSSNSSAIQGVKFVVRDRKVVATTRNGTKVPVARIKGSYPGDRYEHENATEQKGNETHG